MWKVLVCGDFGAGDSELGGIGLERELVGSFGICCLFFCFVVCDFMFYFFYMIGYLFFIRFVVYVFFFGKFFVFFFLLVLGEFY